jgi:hypothetical protein
MGGASNADDDYFTLLGVRPDGTASIVDLMLVGEQATLRRRVEAMLAEHASCQSVEVWRGALLVETFERP